MSRTPISFSLVIGALAVAAVGFGIGLLVAGGDGDHTASEALSADSIGDPTHGRELFVSQGCSMCHQFQGQGGEDAPRLDFMTGRMAAADIAGSMTGKIWNHVPAMKAAFEEEGIPFPTFKGTEMQDLVAYLQDGGPPPNVPEGGAMHSDESGMGRRPRRVGQGLGPATRRITHDPCSEVSVCGLTMRGLWRLAAASVAADFGRVPAVQAEACDPAVCLARSFYAASATPPPGRRPRWLLDPGEGGMVT